ncbi:MAG: VTT domain-containing protein [Desulfobaccales bacterium]
MDSPQPTDSSKTVATRLEAESLLSELAAWLGARPGMADRAEYLFFLAASMIFVMGILALVGYIYLDPVRERLYEAILNKERLRAVIDSAGSWGPLLFIALQASQVLLMLSFLPVEIVGGYIFGLPLGLLYSTLGLSLGALLAFLMARWLEGTYVARFAHPDTMKRYRRHMKREGTLAAFLLFIVPGFPKDIICYMLGLTRMSLWFFLIVITTIRIPSTLLLTLQGAQVYEGNYGITLGLIALYVALAALLYRHRQALYHWVGRWYPEDD